MGEASPLLRPCSEINSQIFNKILKSILQTEQLVLFFHYISHILLLNGGGDDFKQKLLIVLQ